MKEQTLVALRKENEELRTKVNELEETLSAIRGGEIDAIVTSGPSGEQVYTLKGADYSYRTFIETLSEGAATLASDGTIIYCNRSLADLLDVPINNVVGRPMMNFIAPHSLSVVRLLFSRKKRGTRRGELSVRRRDGSLVPVLFSVSPLRLDNIETCVVLTDLRKLKEAQGKLQKAHDELEKKVLRRTKDLRLANESLTESRLKYQALIETTNDFIWETDMFGRYTYCSPQMKTLWGFRPKDMIGKTPFDQMSRKDRKQGRHFFKSLAKSPKPFSIQIPSFDARGNVITIDVNGVPIVDSKGKLIGFRGISRDITERKRAEEALRVSEEKFAKAFRNSPNAITITRLSDGKIIEGNESVYELFGYSHNEVIGKTTAELNIWANPDDRQKLVEGLASKGFIRNEEFVLRKKDKTPMIVNLSASLITLDNQKCFLTSFIDISDRKKTEQALRESEEKFRNIANSSMIHISLTRLDDGRIEFTNQAFNKAYGYASGELVGEKSSIFYTDINDRKKLVENLKKKGLLNNYEVKVKKKDGTPFWTSVSVRIINQGGENIILNTGLDITARKKVEEELRESEERFRALSETTPIGVGVSSEKGEMLYTNPAYELILGYKKGEIVGKKAADLYVDPRERNSWFQGLREGSVVKNIETQLKRKDGTPVWVSINVAHVLYGSKKGTIGTIQDITEQKKADREIFRLISFPENNPNPIVELDLSGTLHYMNPTAQSLFPEIRSAGLKHPFLKEITPQVLRNLSKNPDKTVSFEVSVGTGCYLQILCYIPENQTIHVYSMDITKLKETEETLKESEEKYRMIVENTTNMIMVTQPDGIVSYLSPSCQDVLGYSEKELVGTNPNIIYPEDNELVRKALSRALRGEKGSNFEYRIVTKQGLIKWVSHSWSPIFQNKKLRCVVSVVDDITTRREIEEKIQRLNENLLRHSIELSTINKELEAFSYSVSHDLRAPLRSIDGFSQALLEDYAGKLDDQGKDYLQRVRNAAQHMGQLINDMLRLSRLSRSELTMETVDLSLAAHLFFEKYQKENPSRKIDINIKEGITVTGDKKLLEILMENLLGNAWKFTSKTKRPVIELGETKKDNEHVFFIRDNGAGFDMAYADKLFVPFQRLHSPDEFSGSGIGLAIVSRIVHRHGGRIWAEGEVGKGATFYFTLHPKEGATG